MIDHGTRAGYQQHILQGVPMTDECGCRAAHNEYMNNYVKDHYDPKIRRAYYLRQRENKK